MAKRSDLAIPVAVRLGTPASSIAARPDRRALERRLRAAVGTLVNDLGVPGHPEVVLETVDRPEVLRIRVHGTARPLGGALLWRAWNSVAPDELRSLPASVSVGDRPDAWLVRFLANEPDRELVFGYVEQLVVRGILNRPACLLSPVHATAYARQAPRGSTRPSLIPAELMSVLGFLLDRGASLADSSRVLDTIAEGARFGLSLADVKEVAFDRLRIRGVEILAHPTYLATLLRSQVGRDKIPVRLAAPGGANADFATMEETLFADLGLRLPPLAWTPAASIPEGAIAIKIGDRVELPIPGLGPGELLVDAPADWLEGKLRVPAKSTLNPVTGAIGAIVDESAVEDVDAVAQRHRWTPDGLVVFVLYNDILRFVDRLVSLREVEYEIARLEEIFPELVSSVLARFSLGDLTRILRGLIREGVPIRDLRRIFSRLLQYDAIGVDESEFRLLDDRLAVAEGTDSLETPGWREQLEFARVGLGYYLTHRHSVGDALPCFEIEGNLEKRAHAASGPGRIVPEADYWLDPDEQHEFRQEARRLIGDQVAAVMTTTAARSSLHNLLAIELPHVPVLGRAEISDDVATENLGTIGIP
jgi:hypothetical protein